MILPFLYLIPSNHKADVSGEVTTSAMMHTQFMVIVEEKQHSRLEGIQKKEINGHCLSESLLKTSS